MEEKEAKQGRTTAAVRDWVGNAASIYKTIGASNHCEEERAKHDFYATPPKAVEMLMELEEFSQMILEPCCGAGHIAKVLEDKGHDIIATDLYDHGYGESGIDFLSHPDEPLFDCDIITNPPYNKAKEFVMKALKVVTRGHKVAMFLKLTFLEGKGRKELFDTGQLKTVYVSRSRLACGKNGNFVGESAVAFAWFVWEKGFNGDPIIEWFN